MIHDRGLSSPAGDPLPPEPPVYKVCNTGLHVLLTIFTGGMWLLIWLPLREGYKVQNRRKAIRYQADLSEYRHRMWELKYGNQR